MERVQTDVLEVFTPSTERVTILSSEHEPANVGVLSLVLLSEFEVPVSDESIKSGAVLGALGALVSMTTDKAGAAIALVLPAISDKVTLMALVPSVKSVLDVTV